MALVVKKEEKKLKLKENRAMNTSPHKTKVLNAFLDALRSELKTMKDFARSANEDATHEEAQSEDKHDTRAIEAAYLAKGQAKRVNDLEATLREFQKLLESPPQQRDRVGNGCLVKYDCDGETQESLFSTFGGGTRIELESKIIQIINPHSPLGETLEGLKVGEEVSFETKMSDKHYRILEIN